MKANKLRYERQAAEVLILLHGLWVAAVFADAASKHYTTMQN